MGGIPGAPRTAPSSPAPMRTSTRLSPTTSFTPMSVGSIGYIHEEPETPAPAPAPQPPPEGSAWPAWLFAAAAIVFGTLPIANWIRGGHEYPLYPTMLGEWTSGGGIVLGVAIVLVIASRRAEVIWREGMLDALVAWAHRRPWAFAFALGGAAFVLYATVALQVYAGQPLSIDELVQLVQARTFVDGRLWTPADEYPAFYSILNMVDLDGRYYGQFPAGGPAMLMLGVLLGAPWIVGPLCGAVAVGAFWHAARVFEPRPAVAVGAAMLMACAPFVAFMSGSHMNHVPTLMWLAIAFAAFVRVARDASRSEPRSASRSASGDESRDAPSNDGALSSRARLGLSFLNGLALGCAATIRPVDALAFALPAGLWYLWRAARDRSRIAPMLAAGVGVALPMMVLFWVNASTTGSPTLFGYQLLWGKSHDLGFHRAPWGIWHTPARGVELVNLYFLRLQSYLYEASIPSLLPVAAAMLLARRTSLADRYLLASAALVVALYFAYWHDGFLFGPRFVYTLVPMLALWSARLPALVRERTGRGAPAHRFVWYATFAAAALATFVSVPIRVRDYRNALVAMKLDYQGPAERAGVRDAVILVRESWGTQIMARLWAQGVPRSESELVYRNVDSCILDEALGRLERDGVRDTAAFRALVPLLRDSLRVVKTTYSTDITEKVLPGTAYSETCRIRLAEDAAGFTLLAPLLDETWKDGNVYARDMHARDTLLARRYPGRPFYLLRPVSTEVGAPLEMVRLPEDSLRRAWGR